MKAFFTLLLSTLFTLSSMAYDGTRLTVTSISTNKLSVEIAGRKYNLDGHTVSLNNLRPGVYGIRVFREVKSRNDRGIDKWRNREEVIYSIRATIKNGYHFDLLVNRFGKVMIDERRIDINDDWYDDRDDDYYDNRNRNERDRNGRPYDDGYDNNRNRNDRTYDDRDRDDDGYYDDRDDRYDDDRDYQHSRAMNANDFIKAKESLRKEWLENSRVSAAKQIITQNYFTSQQVKEILLLFTFENNRLELAKHAYANTIDKNNYFIVNDAFTFKNNKDELARYIREFR